VNVGDIQIDSKYTNQTEGPSTSVEGWNTTWPGMPNTTFVEAQKSQEVMNSQEKLIIV
jgi:hypothetical protein